MNYLVTGGSGFFGQAFTKYLLKQDSTDKVIIYSRSEHAQADMSVAMRDKRLRFFIGDVRDRDRLRRGMCGVDIVVHAAALKRIEVGHYNPVEMVKTNVLGAINVIEAAQDAKVKKVVALSTDKAVEPISPYGCSKAMAEALFLAANNTVSEEGPRFSIVRYGNVAGSAGSVIPTWRKMIAGGAKSVPVTDKEATRFWMDISEAVQLVADTIRTMQGGEIAVPTLPAYRLGDLAIALGAETDVKGLPPFEKLHEKMSANQSSDKARRMSVVELQEKLAA